jgi:hypothetical protein
MRIEFEKWLSQFMISHNRIKLDPKHCDGRNHEDYYVCWGKCTNTNLVDTKYHWYGMYKY